MKTRIFTSLFLISLVGCKLNVGNILPELFLLDDLNRPTYAIGGTITGLLGTGTVIANSSDTLALSPGETVFTMPQKLKNGQSYNITIQTYPTLPTQFCSVQNGTGIMGSNDITNVLITCADAYTVSGNIIGLEGSGLVLNNNASDPITVPAGSTSYTFNQPIVPGGVYNTTIDTQPLTPAQSCTFASSQLSESGTVSTSNVMLSDITCVTNSYTIGVSISGLTSTGLTLDYNTAPVTIPNGTTTYTLGTQLSSESYAITVTGQPTGQTCSIAGTGDPASGTVGAAPVVVNISCTTNSYGVTANITGLISSGMVLNLNGTPHSVANGTTSYSLGTLSYGTAYTINIATQPTGTSCTFPELTTTTTGTMGTAPIAVSVTCNTNSYTVSTTISGLNSSGLQLNFNTAPHSIASGTTSYTLGSLFYNDSYTVTITGQPLGLTCNFSNSSTTISGTVGATPVVVSISCSSAGTRAVYMAGYQGVVGFMFDPITAGFVEITPSPLGVGNFGDSNNSSYSVDMKIHPSGNFLYVSEMGYGSNNSGITAFQINANKTLTQVGSEISGIGREIEFSPDGRFLYTGAANTAYGFFGLSINQTTGALSFLNGGVPFGSACSPYSVVVHPDGNFISTVSNTPLGRQLITYAYDTVTGNVGSQVASTPTNSYSVTKLAYGGTNREYLYALNYPSGIYNLFGWVVDTIGNILGTTPSSPYNLFGGQNYVANKVRVSNSGNTIYSLGYSNSTIQVHNINLADGSLPASPDQTLGALNYGKGISLTLDGSIIFVGGMIGYTSDFGIRAFSVDPATGLLTEITAGPFLTSYPPEAIAAE